jgi:hypothetical protein
MKVLLTIEEYRERIIQVVTEITKETIIPEAPDYFKWEFIGMLTEKAITDNLMTIDEVNQLFIRVFEYDRDGQRLNTDTLKRIDQAEVDEFEAQEWYVKYYVGCKKNYRPADRVVPFDQIAPGCEDYRLFDLIRTVQKPFVEDINTKYYIAKEIFKSLYGHDFEYDREFKCT